MGEWGSGRMGEGTVVRPDSPGLPLSHSRIRMADPYCDALIMAGGRIAGVFARAAGTDVKALVPVHGKPVVQWVAEALLATPAIGRVAVVGPEAAQVAAGEACLWARERGAAIANLEAGLERLRPGGEGRVLLCGTDAP